MTLTVQWLNEMFRMWGDRIDKPLEEYLLATYEEEPFPYEWSGEDLFEQIRKRISQYEQGILDISIPSKEERLRDRYESLQDSYVELRHETELLRGLISKAINLLDENTSKKSKSHPF